LIPSLTERCVAVEFRGSFKCVSPDRQIAIADGAIRHVRFSGVSQSLDIMSLDVFFRRRTFNGGNMM